MTPRFTVIVPLYNKAGTIKRTLESIQRQTYRAEHIIVVDDNSTDGSAEIVKSLELPTVQLVHRKAAGPGGYAARNLGVENATTDWVCFLDADDVWLDHHLESAAEIIESVSSINAIFFGRRILAEGNLQRDINVSCARVYRFEELVEMYAERNLFHIDTLLIRRSAFLQMRGFRTDMGWRRGGDSEMFLRLIRDVGPVYVSGCITSVYDTRFSSIVSNDENVVSEHPVHQIVSTALRVQPDPETTVSIAQESLLMRCAMGWFDKGCGAVCISDPVGLCSRTKARDFRAGFLSCWVR